MMADWQPIETAPKDGTPVLLGREFDTHVALAEWDDEAMPPFQWRVPDTEIAYHAKGYTHWMPLPAPPSA